jgi:hypothetical protein
VALFLNQPVRSICRNENGPALGAQWRREPEGGNGIDLAAATAIMALVISGFCHDFVGDENEARPTASNGSSEQTVKTNASNMGGKSRQEAICFLGKRSLKSACRVAARIPSERQKGRGAGL